VHVLAELPKPRYDRSSTQADNPTDQVEQVTTARTSSERGQSRSTLTALYAQRQQAEAALTPDQKKALQDLRVAASSTDSALDLSRIRASIDGIDPDLAKVNREIDACIKTLAPSVRPGALPRLTLTDQSGRPAPGALEQLERQNAQWYAPYAETRRFASSHGLSIEYKRTGDQVTPQFFYQDGKDKHYLNMDASKDLHQEFRRAVESRYEEIERNFNVHILRPGENIAKPFFEDKASEKRWLQGNQLIPARLADLDELIGLQKALEVARPSLEGPKLNVCFLSQATLKGETMPQGQYWKDINGSPTIGLFRERSLGGSQTDHAEAIMEEKGLALHELEHRSQDSSGLTEDKDRLRRLGWIRVEKPPTKDGDIPEPDWVMQGQKGENFKYSIDIREWVRCDAKGNPVNKKGESVDLKSARVSGDYVRNHALVRSADSYCQHPLEQGAQAASLFKTDANKRAELLMTDQTLYRETKTADQKEIDAYYAKHHPGELGVRLPDGSIVTRTPEAEDLVNNFERLFAGFHRENLRHEMNTISDRLQDVHVKLSETGWQDVRKEADYEKLLKSLDAVKPEVADVQRLVQDLERSRFARELQSFIKGERDDLKEYKQLYADTLLQYAVFEVKQGKNEKARELMAAANAIGTPLNLSLSSENLTGEQLQTLFDGLPNLDTVTLANSPMIGDETLARVASLKNLRTLKLVALTGITDGGIAQLANCKSLENLELMHLNLNGSSLKFLGQMPNLQELHIENASGGNAIVDALAGSTSLQKLSLHHTGVNADVFGKIAQMKNLTHLSVDEAGSDAAVRQLLQLTSLQSLALNGTKLTGESINLAKSFPHLTELSLSETSITSADLDSLSPMPLKMLVITTTRTIPPGKAEQIQAALTGAIVMIEGNVPMPLGTLPVPKKYVP
jgi:hypothetical protein